MSEKERKANKETYLCDVEKNKECNKRYCYINGGPCNATRDKTKAKNVDITEAIEYIEESFKATVIHKEKLEIIKSHIEKQEKEIGILKKKKQDVKDRIEYYLVGNVSLDNFDTRNKELRKLEKMLEE